MLFRTARFVDAYHPTGIRDQLPPPPSHGRDYGADSCPSSGWA